MRRMGNHALWVAWLGEGYLQANRHDDALTVARRALDLARAHRERGHEAWVLRLIGEIAFRREPDDAAVAEESSVRALSQAEALGMRPLVAHCHLSLAQICTRANRRAEADTHLATALAMLHEMDMEPWRSEIQARSASA
jgi:tetratricopeptide (TPR) repeat protein